jgi:prephenate dehydratase
LKNLHANQAELKFLGSYPVAGEEGPERRRAASEAWKSATDWMDELRSQIRDDA